MLSFFCQYAISCTFPLQAGHVCGDQKDVINGTPTGSARISFGYMSTEADVDAFLKMIYQCFVDNGPASRTTDGSQEEEWHDAIDDLLHVNAQKDTQRNSSEAQLHQFVLYPIKSCGGFKPDAAWPIGPRGLVYDRTWMVVTASGTALTQSLEPCLALIRPQIDLTNRMLHLHFAGTTNYRLSIDENLTVSLNGFTSIKNYFPGKPNSILIPLDEMEKIETLSRSLCQSKVCGDRIRGTDCGDEVAIWLSINLGRHGVRLVRQLNEDNRSAKGIFFL